FVLFSQSTGHPRHLHSFPTRRSSDLPIARDTRTRAGRRVLRPRLISSLNCFGTDRSTSRLVILPPRPFRGCRGHRAGNRHSVHGDRKSTRLNSSHLGISYAVFCLKKK